MSVFDDPGHFGRLWADSYDGTGNPDPVPAVDFLVERAGGGPVLELAIGTGRVALPLADPAGFDRDEQVQMRSVTEDSATIRLHQYDRTAQTFVRQTITFDREGVHLAPFAMRYCWPEQIDELADRAGLRLVERYADWHRQPFDATSTSHISVYRR
ncbi:hypothetical protein [Micromonospora sp. NBC_00421]|uniref:hypothetical protein n=1 Tax=Micromonospora sp. NBC_00421 TaxID=2975976 RepID=UPI002E1CA39B